MGNMDKFPNVGDVVKLVRYTSVCPGCRHGGSDGTGYSAGLLDFSRARVSAVGATSVVRSGSCNCAVVYIQSLDTNRIDWFYYTSLELVTEREEVATKAAPTPQRKSSRLNIGIIHGSRGDEPTDSIGAPSRLSSDGFCTRIREAFDLGEWLSAGEYLLVWREDDAIVALGLFHVSNTPSTLSVGNVVDVRWEQQGGAGQPGWVIEGSNVTVPATPDVFNVFIQKVANKD